MSRHNRHTPEELKNFIKLFDSISYRHSYYKVFDDFLDLFINGWSFNHKIDLPGIRKIYSQEERNTFGKLIYETIHILNSQIKEDTDFYDVFGTFYELNSLTNKHFAQFFTPLPICRFMAQILEPQSTELFSDPCCGSARFSLAANSVNIGMFHSLVDIDYTCAKMSALNLLLHGIDGIVICDDGLFPGRNFKGAFIVNRSLRYEKIPRIEYVEDVHLAYNYVRKRVGVSEKPISKTNNSVEDHSDIKDIIVNPVTKQFSLF
ncbi:N-6 DNA methylase [Aquimarina mytili]|uniref:site-specific DNA-methyltransferase (adenine-specific) n=1 Tax=Aquimarina mytili TaxID=874423 RepID=A0A937A158_9FLAO|nr:N-6 DNA methylase [Aquimarina mytili]MBL0686106.1 SAM-dependent DNA methyltransferase [Aquimarina mytili]